MKKAMVLVSLLAVLGSGFLFATTLGSDSLTLNYKKVVESTNSIDWFTDVSATSSITSATFSSEETVSAYLRVTNNYTDASPSVLAVFPKLTNGTDATTIGYTIAVSCPTSGVADNAATLVGADSPSSLSFAAKTDSTVESIATIAGDQSAKKTGILLFVFTPDATDLSNATANVDYSGNVVVTLASS